MSAFARSYARAFLESVASGYDIDEFLSRAESVRRALSTDSRLKAFLSIPSIPRDSKHKVLEELARRAGLDPSGARFLDLVLANGRLLHLPDILSTVREESDRRRGLVQAVVTVAAPIGAEEEKRIADRLSRTVGKNVRVRVEVDPAILGGFVARVGSEVFDASARGAVEAFSQHAKEIAGA
jgi:F-type H+-transporting ATPase subunit delta